jgi:methylenetetrahydrofolate reductase (NADPH)
MKITDVIAKKEYSVSFEVFPPKTDTAFESVEHAVEEIASLGPSFMSVTYGAGGGTSKYTLNIAKNIMDKYSVPSIAHLTCVSSSRETVRDMIGKIQSAGIENVLALRGDIPEGCADDKRYYNHAIDLMREIKDSGAGFCVGGACYPEKHPECPSKKEDIIHLKEKADAGFKFFTSQMFFDNNLFYNFMYRIREQGITVPIIPGIMPITKANQVARAISLSGSFVPQRFINLVDKFGDNPDAMMQAGIAYATDQIIDLFANGITHVHVYSMNNPGVARAIMKNLSEIIGKRY